MEHTKPYYYRKVAEAITYLENHFTTQPNLETLAEQVHISPYHFQKIFKDWVGVSPKKYLQFISLNYAKTLLNKQNLANTAYDIGLSGTGRLHDMFVNIEGMTPGEYKNGGKNLSIDYCFSESYFGNILVASTSKGICHIGFSDDKQTALSELFNKFPNANILENSNDLQKAPIAFFNADWDNLPNIKLHLKGTEFQIKVWESLLKIPSGRISTYKEIAEQIGNPKASRAVGTAIGNNPIAYLIPCHRVILASGNTGQYHWGAVRKKAMLAWEAVKSESTKL